MGRSFNSFKVCGAAFHIDKRYELIKAVGVGAFGVVCAANDAQASRKVAVKKISSVFDNLLDAKRVLREIRLMRHLQHENLLRLFDVMKPVSFRRFEDVYLVTELMDTDLHQIIGSQQQLTDAHIQYFLYQVLRGLHYIHSAGVIHRDLKPSNLLVNANCDLKICDFGLARRQHENSEDMTEYVATRWYRAPEVMLSWREYTKAMDVWSVGCILAELLGRSALFPGRDYMHQINLILNVLGSPSKEEIADIKVARARRYIESLCATPKPKVPFNQLYPNASADALDLLEKMITFDPKKRITIPEALAHPYMANLHDEGDEPIVDFDMDFSFEGKELERKDLEDLILEEITCYHPELPQERDEELEGAEEAS